MADLEKALHTRLTGYAGLSSLISARLYPVIAPQNPTYPLATYQRVSGDREEGMTGHHGLAQKGLLLRCGVIRHPAGLANAPHEPLREHPLQG